MSEPLPIFDSPPGAPVEVATFTERQMLDRLRARHAKVVGNGPVWSYMEHTRGNGLVRAKQAPRLRSRPVGMTAGTDLPRGLVAAMLRSCARTGAA